MLKANDTDVVVIAFSVFPSLPRLELEHLWVTFGQGHSLCWISVHDIYHYMGQVKIKGISFFHAFTVCDTLSVFHNKGKKTAWQTWEIFPDPSPVFSKLSQYPLTVEDDDLAIQEKFAILMYDRSCTAALWMRPDLTWLAESRYITRQFHQPEQICFNTPDHYDLCPVDSCLNLLSVLGSRNGVMGMRTSPPLRALLINSNPCSHQQFS